MTRWLAVLPLLTLACIPTHVLRFEHLDQEAGPVTVVVHPVNCQADRTVSGVIYWVSEGLFTLTISNHTGDLISIDWDRSSFVDQSNLSHRIIHGGVWLRPRDQRLQVPTVVPAGAALQDAVFPTDRFNDRDDPLPIFLCDPGVVDTRYVLVLAYTRNGTETQLLVPFRVSAFDIAR